MKVIFLDIDGVLTCYKSIMDKHQLDVLYPNEFHLEIDEDKVKLLGNICNEVNAKIVLTSSWRGCWYDGKPKEVISAIELQKLFDKYNIEVVGITPCISNKIHNDWREDEIKWYLDRHLEIDSFCVIDDDDYDLLTLNEYLVKTEFGTEDNQIGGLLEEHVDEIKNILNKKVKVKKP